MCKCPYYSESQGNWGGSNEEKIGAAQCMHATFFEYHNLLTGPLKCNGSQEACEVGANLPKD